MYKIVEDITKFDERTDEIEAGTSYDKVKHVVAQLKDALYELKDVPALCAPQIGEDLRLFVVKTSRTEKERFKVFLNPLIISGEGYHLSREVSASIPKKEFIVPRRDKIHVAYQLTDGQPNSETFVGAYGEVVQQMIQMLDGITLADIGLDLDDVGGPKAFNNATKKDQQAVIEMYLNSMKAYSKELSEEIQSNPVLKNINDTINFNTGLLDGSIKPLDKDGNEINLDEARQQAQLAELKKLTAEMSSTETKES